MNIGLLREWSVRHFGIFMYQDATNILFCVISRTKLTVEGKSHNMSPNKDHLIN